VPAEKVFDLVQVGAVAMGPVELGGEEAQDRTGMGRSAIRVRTGVASMAGLAILKGWEGPFLHDRRHAFALRIDADGIVLTPARDQHGILLIGIPFVRVAE